MYIGGIRSVVCIEECGVYRECGMYRGVVCIEECGVYRGVWCI